MFHMYTLMDSYPLLWHTQKRVIGYELVGKKARTHVMCTQHVITEESPRKISREKKLLRTTTKNTMKSLCT